MLDSPIHFSSPRWAVRTAALAVRLNNAVKTTGLWFGALNILLLGVILVQIGMRHLFTGGHQIILGELQWHLYATAIMFGLAYAQSINSHVRVDVLSRNWTPRRRAAVEIFGNLFLIMPFVVIMFLQGLDYVSDSWRVSERSDSPVGLSWRWLIKSVIPASFALWFVALFARLLQDTVLLLVPSANPAEESPPATVAAGTANIQNHASDDGEAT